METIYTGACSAALNGNVGVPAVSFRMPCVSSQLVLLFLFFSFLFFPPPSLPFQGTSGRSYTSVEGSIAICEQLSSFALPCPLYCELHKHRVSFFAGRWGRLLAVTRQHFDSFPVSCSCWLVSKFCCVPKEESVAHEALPYHHARA